MSIPKMRVERRSPDHDSNQRIYTVYFDPVSIIPYGAVVRAGEWIDSKDREVPGIRRMFFQGLDLVLYREEGVNWNDVDARVLAILEEALSATMTE